MAWLTLGEALEAALVSMNEVGDGDGCSRPDAVKLPKGTGAVESPGQVTGLRQKEEKPDGASHERTNAALPMGRRMTVATASPKAVGSPTRAAVIRLVIDNGDRPERREEQLSGRSIAQQGNREPARNLRVVVG